MPAPVFEQSGTCCCTIVTNQCIPEVHDATCALLVLLKIPPPAPAVLLAIVTLLILRVETSL